MTAGERAAEMRRRRQVSLGRAPSKDRDKYRKAKNKFLKVPNAKRAAQVNGVTA